MVPLGILIEADMITLLLSFIIVLASIVQPYADTILRRTRAVPADRPERPPCADPSRTVADRQKALDSIAYYDTQLSRLYELIDAAKLDLIAARKAAADPAPTEKTAARRRAEYDRLLRRVITLERSIYTYETARSKAAARLEP